MLACGTPNSGPGARPLDHPAAVVEQPIATVDDAQGAAVVEVTSQRCRVPTVNPLDDTVAAVGDRPREEVQMALTRARANDGVLQTVDVRIGVVLGRRTALNDSVAAWR